MDRPKKPGGRQPAAIPFREVPKSPNSKEAMDFENTAGTLDQNSFTFHGSYQRSVDAKGRFNLPFRFRQGGPGSADEKYVVSGGADGSLALLPYSVWIANFNRMRQGEPGPELRRNLRRMSRSSTVVEPDSQGRVAINAEILGRVGITGKVTVVGMVSYMELWDPDTLEKTEAAGDDLDAGFMNEFYR